ncbi:MAG: hypothetical protein K2Y25_13090 [Pseudomonadaceae bacterium]|jgi:hypothetical protein|nr:hypothetical protein [Pseudomonadaceae bacterium]
MQYDGLALGVALLALLALLIAARILFNPSWFSGFLRGCCGLAFVAIAGFILLLADDLRSYQPLIADAPLVTVSFQAQGQQSYQVSLQEGAVERVFTLEGDLWQLDARLLQWKGLAGLIGLQTGYRLEKLSGRFLAIEQQDKALHTEAILAQSPYGVDLWRWLRTGPHDLFLLNAQARRVTYLPMADQAVYSVTLTPTGLLAQPLNQVATQALKDWQ